jgi:hypothetical protein
MIRAFHGPLRCMKGYDMKNTSQLDYTNKEVTVSIRRMDTGVWAYALYVAKRNKLTIAELIAKLLELLDETDLSNE